MARLSIYRDGFVSDSLLHPCGDSALDSQSSSWCSDPELELRNLLGEISSRYLKNPSEDLLSEFTGFKFPSGSPPNSDFIQHSELLDRWVRKFHAGEDDDACDQRFPLRLDLKRRIEGLVDKILSEKVTGLQDRDSCCLKEREAMNLSVVSGADVRNGDSMSDMLMRIRRVAADPCNPTVSGAVREWRKWSLQIRQALFLNTAEISDMEEFPYRKKQKTHQFLCETSRTTANLSSENPHVESSRELCPSFDSSVSSLRRSQRSIGLLKFNESHLPRKRIPTGSFFQADVPDWTGSPNQRIVSNGNENLNDSRWLGTRLWPIEGGVTKASEKIGKGRPELCSCTSPRSLACIRFHVSKARLQLKSDLGGAFFSMGFDQMGEEVSKSWTGEEQMTFDTLVKLNPESEDKSFWEPALENFPSRSRRSIVSYYFNVFVLRRMSNRTRLASETAVDSDDDENDDKVVEASYSTNSQRRCLKRKS